MLILNRRRAGFSLIELMIALTILAIALIPVAYFYTKSLQMVEEAGVRNRALMLAQERISELQQMPYDQLFANVTPSPEQLLLYSKTGVMDTTAADWFGYDFQASGESAAMFRYALPLNFNPYDPRTQGYDNTEGLQFRYQPFLPAPFGGVSGSKHVNFHNGVQAYTGGVANTGSSAFYEYEPIGFYSQHVYQRNANMGGFGQNINLSDRRTIGPIEPPVAGGADRFRTGYDSQVDNYAVFGRRTIILDVLPLPLDNPQIESDGDSFAPHDERDGGATIFDPYPIGKGPNNKFKHDSYPIRRTPQGRYGKVVVFWLPRKAASGYIPYNELNKIELPFFIPARNDASSFRKTDASGMMRPTDWLNISPVD